MIPLIPYKRYSLHLAMSPQQAAEVVAMALARKQRGKRRTRAATALLGTCAGDCFKILQRADYGPWYYGFLQTKNAFRHVIFGRIHPQPQGVEVVITLRQHPLVIAFLCFCFGFLLYSALRTGLLLEPDQEIAASLSPYVGMDLLVYLFAVLGFGLGLAQAEKIVAQIFGLASGDTIRKR